MYIYVMYMLITCT